jgi:hypothetical protein
MPDFSREHKMKKTLCLLCVFTTFYAGCAGREANPVSVYMPGDAKRDCASLQIEMGNIQTEITEKLPDIDKTGYNTVCIITGLFIIVPFFFMDLKNADKTEVNALRQRYTALSLIAANRGCVLAGMVGNSPVFDNDPSHRGKKFVGYRANGTDVNGNPILVPVYE